MLSPEAETVIATYSLNIFGSIDSYKCRIKRRVSLKTSPSIHTANKRGKHDTEVEVNRVLFRKI